MRDPVDVFAFHVDVPAGATTLDVNFQFASPVDNNEGRMVMTPDMLNLQWNAVVLYPAGYFARQIMVEPSVRLPEGWEFATALETAASNGGVTTFKPVPLDTLVDSPMFAGRYFKRLDLDPGGPAPVHLNIVADRAELLEVKPEQLEAHRALVQQAYKLYGSHHYDHYDFLLALTDHMGGIGLEHHQSSENGTVPTYFTEWDKNADTRDLLPHEYTHSWNGKFRRPADLWTPNFNVPMRDSLLWVYEGQTQYWGFVLAARSGLLTKQQTLDAIAATAALYDHRVGREWRALQDTTNDPITAMRRPLPWRSWERSEDYYSEGQLMWLDADTLIREKSGGKRSLDDFARTLFRRQQRQLRSVHLRVRGCGEGAEYRAALRLGDVPARAAGWPRPRSAAGWHCPRRLQAGLHGHAVRLFQGLRNAPQGHRPDLFSWHDRSPRKAELSRRAVGRACVQERPDRRHSDHCRQRDRV